MSQAISDLLNEHEAILSALNILDRMTSEIEIKKEVNPTDMTEFINFLKEFADKCHHGKEEGMLFPAMAAAGISEPGGPIGVMLEEHQEGRRLIKQMSDALIGDVNAESLTQAARGYIFLLRNHINKENAVLFPMAEKVLNQQKLEDLYKGFVEHEENVIGHGRHEELHAMLEMLNEKYA